MIIMKINMKINKNQYDFSISFWIIADNNLCDQHKFMILTFC